jgi:hypothetical protein
MPKALHLLDELLIDNMLVVCQIDIWDVVLRVEVSHRCIRDVCQEDYDRHENNLADVSHQINIKAAASVVVGLPSNRVDVLWIISTEQAVRDHRGEGIFT